MFTIRVKFLLGILIVLSIGTNIILCDNNKKQQLTFSSKNGMHENVHNGKKHTFHIFIF